MTHLLLTIFLGWTGYARFRKGQIGLGVLWFFTVGCFTVGWIIDIIDAVKEMNKPAPAAGIDPKSVDLELVYVNKGSKVYHYDYFCATSRSFDCEKIKEKEAVKRGLKPCKNCGGFRY